MGGKTPSLLNLFLILDSFIYTGCSSVTVVVKSVGRFDGTTHIVDYHVNGKNKTGNVDMFLGIPYAKPPVGKLRFVKPIPVFSYDNTVNATVFAPMCTQEYEYALPTKFENGEDCLYLNIYRPHKGQNLAVMVFIHGGFDIGQYNNGASNYISGDVFAVYTDVIVVTFNYRIGLLGFFATNEKENVSPGNFGLWDQHAALRWIHRTIAGFGGDPNRITIAGQQTGAICALYQAMYPGNKGLFQQVITQSGSPIELAKRYEGAFTRKPGSYGVSHSLGCLISDYNDTMSCLRYYPFDKLKSLMQTLRWPISPVYDGEFVKADPRDMLNPDNTKYSDVQRFFSSLNMIIGYNEMDGLVFFKNLFLPKFLWPQTGDFDAEEVNADIFKKSVDYSVNTDMYGVPWRTEKEPSEIIFSRYYNILKPDDYSQTLGRFATDYYYLTPALLLVDKRRQLMEKIYKDGSSNRANAVKTYLYKFTANPGVEFRSRTRPAWADGANNGDEMLFLFGFSRRMLDALSINSTYIPSDTNVKVSEQMMIKWGEFIRRGSVNSILNDNGIAIPKWPSCFERFATGNADIDMSELKYWEISGPLSSKDPNAAIKHDFSGVMGRFWLSLKDYVSDSTGKINSKTVTKGTLLGLDPNTAEIVIIVFVIISFILIVSLLIMICCLSFKRRCLEYDAVGEAKKC